MESSWADALAISESSGYVSSVLAVDFESSWETFLWFATEFSEVSFVALARAVIKSKES